MEWHEFGNGQKMLVYRDEPGKYDDRMEFTADEFERFAVSFAYHYPDGCDHQQHEGFTVFDFKAKPSLDAMTAGLPKLREVAAYVCSCEAHSFSLSQYSATTVFKLLRTLALDLSVNSQHLDSPESWVIIRVICETLESYLVKTEFCQAPLAPPYIVQEYRELYNPVDNTELKPEVM
jgi:hypothetical protein